ncbi:MAG: hypothetical protein PVI66_12240 [Candidatus Aminicenantes bacterium]
MRKLCSIALLVLGLPILNSAQEVGTSADTQMERRLSLQLSYEHISRNFTLGGIEEKVGRKIFRGKLSFRPFRVANFYSFIGSSEFPNSYVNDGSLLYFGGGCKLMMLGEVYVEEEDGDTITVKAGIGLDFQISRLQSTNNRDYVDFGLTEFQGSLDFGLRVFWFVGYFGFKFSKISGEFTELDDSRIKAEGTGLFSLFLGFNVHLTQKLVLISEFSFFTEKSWALGLRVDI